MLNNLKKAYTICMLLFIGALCTMPYVVSANATPSDVEFPPNGSGK